VWNSKNQESRGTVVIVVTFDSGHLTIVPHALSSVVPIVPSTAWVQSRLPTNGSDIKPSLLGLSVRMCEPEFSLESVWHVLDVLEGSPAESAGLVPYGDWIIGWSGGVLSAEGDFYDVVEAVWIYFITMLVPLMHLLACRQTSAGLCVLI
jgi:S1-C subfamily serine protease